MAAAAPDLTGLRVLIVEDNLLLAEATAETLQGHGCTVVGPVPDLASGLELARGAELEGALLDINLGGEFCFPIAVVLTGRAVPFLFVTGYDNPRLIPRDFHGVPRLSKPVAPDELVAAAADAFRH